MYKKAAKLGLCFESKVGLVNVEDLFNLPLISNTKVSLDAIAKEVNKQLIKLVRRLGTKNRRLR